MNKLNISVNVRPCVDKSFGSFQGAKQVAEKMRPYAEADREMVLLLMLNQKNELIKLELSAIGTINQSTVYPREVAKAAVLCAAAAMIIVHNHPSGSPAPSTADREITRQLYAVCRLLDVALLDHVILGSTGYFSFADSGELEAIQLTTGREIERIIRGESRERGG